MTAARPESDAALKQLGDNVEAWRRAIAANAGDIWPTNMLGPAPGDPKCVVPRELVREMRLAEIYSEHGIRRPRAPAPSWPRHEGRS